MGIWEDAQAQNRRADQVSRQAADAHETERVRQTNEIAEFIAAMHRLGVATQRYTLHTRASGGRDTDATYPEVGEISGWAIFTYIANNGQYSGYPSKTDLRNDQSRYYIVVTDDGSLYNTRFQDAKKGAFGTRKLILSPLTLPLLGYELDGYMCERIPFDLSFVLRQAVAGYMRNR